MWTSGSLRPWWSKAIYWWEVNVYRASNTISSLNKWLLIVGKSILWLDLPHGSSHVCMILVALLIYLLWQPLAPLWDSEITTGICHSLSAAEHGPDCLEQHRSQPPYLECWLPASYSWKKHVTREIKVVSDWKWPPLSQRGQSNPLLLMPRANEQQLEMKRMEHWRFTKRFLPYHTAHKNYFDMYVHVSKVNGRGPGS